MKRTRVFLGSRSYDIVIGRGLLRSCGRTLEKLDIGTDAVVITNGRLRRLYGRALQRSLEAGGFSVRFEIVPDSERAKSIAVAAGLIKRISSYDIRKRPFIVAFGGGVVGDLAGFVAAVYKRGIPYLQIPTTLLAQVDSAIGGKVAIDLPVAKNLVGAFYQPRIVISDVSLLKSLPIRQVRNGLAEIIKYGVIKDARLFRFVEKNISRLLKLDPAALEHVVHRSSVIKAGFVAKDELDRKGVRALLNYGHTFGHALETASGYSGRYNHGEAVAIGMLVAARIAADRGHISDRTARRIESLARKAGLPTVMSGVSLPAIYRAHLHDKKFTGRTNRFILPLAIGRARVVANLPDAAIRNALRESAA